MKDISVLMAVYYKEEPHFLDLAIASIWTQQTKKPDQIVFLEDGELTSDLYLVLDKWQKEIGSVFQRIKISENMGLTAALNIGIEYCNCKYIARMDSDDLSTKDRFLKQFTYMEQNKDIHVLGGAIQEIGDDLNVLNLRTYPSDNESIKKYIVKASPLAHATVMFRRTIFDDGIRYSEKYSTSQDIELWYRLLKHNYNLANISDVTYLVRVNDSFFKRRSKKKAFNESLIYIKGTYSLFGLRFSMIYPIIRYFVRLSPAFISKRIYSGKLRQSLNKS